MQEEEEEAMEIAPTKWRFQGISESKNSINLSIYSALDKIRLSLDKDDQRLVIPLGYADPSTFPSYYTDSAAEDAIADAVRSAKFNSYSPSLGLPQARRSLYFTLCLVSLSISSFLGKLSRLVEFIEYDIGDFRAVADYLSRDLPYSLSADDVYLTAGCVQGIQTVLTALSFSGPGANVLLPRPGFPIYENRADFAHIETRHFDLLPEKDWEVDLDAIETIAD